MSRRTPQLLPDQAVRLGLVTHQSSILQEIGQLAQEPAVLPHAEQVPVQASPESVPGEVQPARSG